MVSFECLVCSYSSAAARVACDALYDLPVEDCKCGDTHDRQALLEALDTSDPKEDPDRSYCGECLESEEMVVPDGATTFA